MHGYTGTLNDALKWHDRQKFSTFDSDNDGSSTADCVSKLFGDWWFFHCNDSHLNGKYYSGGKMAIDVNSKNILIYTGIHWYSNGFNDYTDSLIFTEMKLRRKL